MLFLRYQRQRQSEAEDGCANKASNHEMRRKINDRDLKGESHRAATRGTLICIFVCGSTLLSLGLAILFVGLYVEVPRNDRTPWLVIGPTCIVLGVLVLLLSVEIILKLRKISSSSRSSSEPETPKKMSQQDNAFLKDPVLPKAIPVIVHPATPLQLDPVALPVEVVQHR